mgnify:CR=1 FL=1
MILTDVEISIVSVILDEEEPLTSYRIATLLKTYSQNIEHRLEKLVKLGILIRIEKDSKTKYNTHEVLRCERCIKEISKAVGRAAEVIDGHGITDNGGLNSILYFICNRVTFVRAGTPDKCTFKPK